MRLSILKSLIIFFLGFMTAIYVVAPEPNTETMRVEILARKVNKCTKQFISSIWKKKLKCSPIESNQI